MYLLEQVCFKVYVIRLWFGGYQRLMLIFVHLMNSISSTILIDLETIGWIGLLLLVRGFY